MNETAIKHQEQLEYWNGAGGAKWVKAQNRTDIMLAPVSATLLDHANIRAGETVIDIGCGCGATTRDLTDAVGSGGHVTGLDVSELVLARARKLLEPMANMELVLADASTTAFALPVDLVFSRFGVMFFGDPVAAFINIRRALKPTGRMIFACWRAFDQNDWMQLPLHAVYDHVPRLPKPGLEDPGPFSFADPDRVSRILTAAGFAQPKFTPIDLQLDVAAGGGLDAAVEQCTVIGAASRALNDQPPSVFQAAVGAIRDVLRTHVQGDKVPLPGAIWIVETQLA